MADYSGYAGVNLSNMEMGLLVSQQILPKVFSQSAYHKGFMIDDRYTQDLQAVADVLIAKISRPKGRFANYREAGYNVFENSVDKVTQEFDILKVDMAYTEQIEISEEQILQNIIGDKVIGYIAGLVSETVAEQLNFITGEAIYKSVLAYNKDLALADRKIAYFTDGTSSMPDLLATLVAKIGNADPTKGDTSFNSKPISQVISNTAFSKFIQTKNQFVLESSLGQKILIDGSFGEITLADVTAFVGVLMGIPTFKLPDAFFPSVGNEVNFPNSVMPTAGKVMGILGIAESTVRAFVDRGIKVIDHPDFRGWALQPLYRVGVNNIKPWGNALLVTHDFVHEDLLERVTLTFDSKGGTAVPTQVIVKGTKPTAPAVGPTKEGKVFSKWVTTTDGSTDFDFTAALTANATAYATYTDAA